MEACQNLPAYRLARLLRHATLDGDVWDMSPCERSALLVRGLMTVIPDAYGTGYTALLTPKGQAFLDANPVRTDV